MTQPAKHTPRPWVVRNRDAVYAQSGRFIADCELTPYGSRPQPPNSIDEANAHLIAAAPAMYEALETVPLPKHNEAIGEFYTRFYTWYEGQVKQVLSQAEGRQA